MGFFILVHHAKRAIEERSKGGRRQAKAGRSKQLAAGEKGSQRPMTGNGERHRSSDQGHLLIRDSLEDNIVLSVDLVCIKKPS